MGLPLIEGLSYLFESFEPGADQTATRATPHTFTGTNTATTVVSSALTGTVATNYVGCLIEALDGNQVGQRRLVLAFNPATDTATTEAWKGTANATQFRMWILPRPMFVQSGAGTAGNPGPPAVPFVTATDVSGRLGYTNSWVTLGGQTVPRYMLFCEQGANANRVGVIVSSTASTATLDPFANWVAGAAGDLYTPIKLIRHHGGEFVTGDMGQALIERPFTHANFEREPGTLAPRTAAISFACEIHGCSAGSTGATAAKAPTEASDFLDSMMDLNADATTTVGAGSSTTSITVTTGQGTQADGRFRIGSIVLIAGEATCITAMVDGGAGVDTWTVTPALTVAPVSGTPVYGGVCFTPLYPERSHRTHGFDQWLGGKIRRRSWAGLCNVKLEGVLSEEVARLMFEYKLDGHYAADGWDIGNLTFPKGRMPTEEAAGSRLVPSVARAGRVMLAGATVAVRNFTFDWGYDIQQKSPAVTNMDKADGPYVANRMSRGTIGLWFEDIDEIERFERGAETELLLQMGIAQRQTYVLYLPKVQYTGVPIGKENGGYIHDIAFEVRRSNLSGSDGGTTTRTVSDVTLAVF